MTHVPFRVTGVLTVLAVAAVDGAFGASAPAARSTEPVARPVLVAPVAGATLDPKGARVAQYYPTPNPSPAGASPAKPLQLLRPFPVVRLAGRLTSRGGRIRVLSVRAPANTAIFVRCRRRGCTGRSVKRGRGINRAVRFRRFERPLRAGTILEVIVRRQDTIGKFTLFRIRRRRLPKRVDLCLRPGGIRGVPCPDA
jgi:hypothetical protein